ncbi:hypothetical protein ACQKMD_08985 [Viridibacillus sp. NPDC096237]|uniref:hypothetical protein n=1 Tax=Viridibacillus sp. NPDC096237 TaxID=3390721 RepID=UPI003D0791BE
MGLDIKTYRNLTVVLDPKFDEEGELLNWATEWRPGDSMDWSEKNFPGRAEGIDSQKVYTWAEVFRFRAGSYSGFNWWRSKLEQFSNNEAFQELINFADNEGVIGFVVAKKLAKDFYDNAEKAKDFADTLDEGEYWIDLYRNWQKAFEMAADNGAVEFR